MEGPVLSRRLVLNVMAERQERSSGNYGAVEGVVSWRSMAVDPPLTPMAAMGRH